MLIGGAALLLVLVLGITGIGRVWKGSDSVAAEAAAGTAAVKVSEMKKASGKTNDDRLKFIRAFGWEVEEEPAEIMEVIIPEEFDDVYTQYNAIQKKQGCDLEQYQGKRCKRYAYVITNYPGTEEAVQLTLLVCKNKVIGGDISSVNPDGFIHGFEMPQ
ncbi:DUF4830 domain-containing protein [Ruminococcaceae bacterium OttesenSCG-928-L11]|nr:DUF4830 domain-containing protein [Ruminococcaceae bacterium OttesenSCG-928-L11]